MGISTRKTTESVLGAKMTSKLWSVTSFLGNGWFVLVTALLEPLPWYISKAMSTGKFISERSWKRSLPRTFWYQIFPRDISPDIEKRKKSKGLPIHKRKLFKSNQQMIFEQDFAQPHSTNKNQEFMEVNFPAHTPTLWRYQDIHELFFGAKWDDFWSIEGLRAILS